MGNRRVWTRDRACLSRWRRRRQSRCLWRRTWGLGQSLRKRKRGEGVRGSGGGCRWRGWSYHFALGRGGPALEECPSNCFRRRRPTSGEGGWTASEEGREEGRGESSPIRKVQTILGPFPLYFLISNAFETASVLRHNCSVPVPSLPFARHSPPSPGLCRPLQLRRAVPKPCPLKPACDECELVRCVLDPFYAAL